jgi:hypothetical protein
MALTAYAGTMAAALTVLMVLWNSIVGPPVLEKVRQPPHPVVRVFAPDNPITAAATTPAQPGRWGPAIIHKAADGADIASVEDARIAAAKVAAAEKARHLKVARQQKRREEMLARQREQQEYSTALGYGREEAPQYGQGFGPFSQGRF